MSTKISYCRIRTPGDILVCLLVQWHWDVYTVGRNMESEVHCFHKQQRQVS